MTVLGQVRHYLLTVAGPVRSPAHNVQLAALLALNAGVLNSVGFVAVSVYTSHMTGIVSATREGRHSYYTVEDPHVVQLVEQIFDIIREINTDGVTVLLVEQNAAQALGLANRGYVLETGEIVLSGTGKDLLADDRVRAAYLGEEIAS